MSLDTATAASPEELFAGFSSSAHDYYRRNNLVEVSDGKQRMHDAVESMILTHGELGGAFRFMSLPGKFWRFETRLFRTLKAVHFTAFERDHRIVLGGAAYVPREIGKHQSAARHGFRKIESLGVEYFKTNLARWLSMDVNHALSLNDSMFWKIGNGHKSANHCCRMDWWLKKFCGWDAAWLDYFCPASESVGTALSNLHWHCRRDSVPVAVTILKGRESGTEPISDRRRWMINHLCGGSLWSGLEFAEIDYFEYSDGGATMCNLLGVLKRTSKALL